MYHPLEQNGSLAPFRAARSLTFFPCLIHFTTPMLYSSVIPGNVAMARRLLISQEIRSRRH